nr:MAG TPA: hypothetical protein [Caudoviricetes sp.]
MSTVIVILPNVLFLYLLWLLAPIFSRFHSNTVQLFS